MSDEVPLHQPRTRQQIRLPLYVLCFQILSYHWLPLATSVNGRQGAEGYGPGKDTVMLAHGYQPSFGKLTLNWELQGGGRAPCSAVMKSDRGLAMFWNSFRDDDSILSIDWIPTRCIPLFFSPPTLGISLALARFGRPVHLRAWISLHNICVYLFFSLFHRPSCNVQSPE